MSALTARLYPMTNREQKQQAWAFVFPLWGASGLWSYELRTAAIMLWLAEAFRHFDIIGFRYVVGFPLWYVVEMAPNLVALFLATASILIITGFAVKDPAPRCSLWLRTVGFICTLVSFGGLAGSFLVTSPWSIAGGCCFFLAWGHAGMCSALIKQLWAPDSGPLRSCS